MLRIMCCTMCTLNMAMPYVLSLVHIVRPMVTTPAAKATVRPTGQASPRSRSRTTAVPYRTSRTTHSARKNGSPPKAKPRPRVKGGSSAGMPGMPGIASPTCSICCPFDRPPGPICPGPP